jgi:hypothetical protein
VIFARQVGLAGFPDAEIVTLDVAQQATSCTPSRIRPSRELRLFRTDHLRRHLFLLAPLLASLVVRSGEIIVALLIMFLTFFPHGPVVIITEYEPPFWDKLATKTVAIFAGVYAFVRGLDNINTGLPSSSWRTRWDWLIKRVDWRRK